MKLPMLNVGDSGHDSFRSHCRGPQIRGIDRAGLESALPVFRIDVFYMQKALVQFSDTCHAQKSSKSEAWALSQCTVQSARATEHAEHGML